ncbi:hypothetical protein AB0E67_32165 [Streptomyces sp. NPDC032161]|uniref:hypothetical protein n=1 Tax=unclassified Streptomyces TaxID=2593676 RepID=UPI0033C72019
MTVPPVPPRHALLPDRERSRAVLVASNAGLRQWPSLRQPAELTARLAQALTSPGPGGAFHRKNTALLLGPERPADVLDALRHAAETASDVLLFWYAGRGFPREGGLAFGVTESDPQHAADTGVDLDAVAEIMSTGRAARRVVVLDCDHAATATTRFTGTAPAPSLMAAETSSFWPMADPFTETLVDGLTGGVQEGPETLDLVTLHDAIEAAYTRTRYYVENEYIGGPSHVLLRGGRELALGVNPAFGLPNGSGALPPHPDVVHAQESW